MMRQIFELKESTSTIMWKLDRLEYSVVVDSKTFEPFVFDELSRKYYHMPEEVEYWRAYIRTYMLNRAEWSKIYN